MSSTPTSTPQPWTYNAGGQAGPGETVTLTITRPDGTAAAPQTGTTDANGNATGTFTDTVPDQTTGKYNASFAIGSDATYQADTISGTFTIVPALLARNPTATIGNSGTITG